MRVNSSNVVQQLLSRNERALTFIIHEYGGLLTAIIKRHLDYQQQDFEECLDDVLLSVWNHIQDYNPKNSFKNWIAVIAKYKAIDYRRRQISLQSKQFSVSEIRDSMLTPDGHSSHAEKDIEELLDQLSASERTIFEKYYLEGMPSREIAQQYNARESWVYNKLSRGRRKLRNFLTSDHKT